jgi:Mg2+ and Co2+ transporter CorA
MPDRLHLPGRVSLIRRRPRAHPESTRPDDGPTRTSRSGVVDSAVYCDGKRQCSPRTLADTFQSLRDQPDGMAWIGLYRPDVDELNSLAKEFDLHPLAVEDAINAHQRPKLERYGDTLFVVLRAARYLDDVEEVEFGELHVFIGKDFVITVRHAESPDLSVVRHRLEDDPELLANGTEAVLYAILDAVVDGYLPVVAGIENDVDEIETQVFDGDPAVSRRIYELSREVVDFQRAASPLTAMLESLAAGFDKYARRRGAPPAAARRRRPRHAGDRTRRRPAGAAARHPAGQLHPRGAEAERGDDGAQPHQQCAERRGQEDLGLGGDRLRPDHDRLDLRHELPRHARTVLGARLPVRDRAHDRHRHRALHPVQAEGLDLTCRPTPSR